LSIYAEPEPQNYRGSGSRLFHQTCADHIPVQLKILFLISKNFIVLKREENFGMLPVIGKTVGAATFLI
jgi:hypothetical protein